jgi:hypothetical protein
MRVFITVHTPFNARRDHRRLRLTLHSLDSNYITHATCTVQELHLAVSTVSDAGLRPLSRLTRLAVLNASMCFKLTPK